LNTKPTPSHRHIMFGIETVTTNPKNPKGPLSATSSRIACICLIIDDGNHITDACLTGSCEARILADFWDQIHPNDVFIGRSIPEFDLSFVRQRSFVNGVKPKRDIDLRRFYSHDVIDVMDLGPTRGTTVKLSPDDLANVFGLAGKTRKAHMVAEWWTEGNLDSIEDSCREDVHLTFQTFLRLTFQPLPARYHAVPIAEEVQNMESPIRSRD